MNRIALVLLLAGIATPARAQQPIPPATPVIVTSGQGVVKKAPDQAWVAIAAESRAKTAPEAQRLNTEAMNAVIDKIKSFGIAADAVQTAGYSLQPDYEYQNGRQLLRGYVSRNQVEVRVDTLSKLGDIMASTAAAGATSISGVRFDLKDRESAESEALRMAVRDARRRADAAAAGANVRIAQVMRIDEQRDEYQPPVPMARMATLAMGAAPAPQAVPVEAGQIEVRAHVTLTVRIE
jgi:uncharacterized protein YggE